MSPCLGATKAAAAPDPVPIEKLDERAVDDPRFAPDDVRESAWLLTRA